MNKLMSHVNLHLYMSIYYLNNKYEEGPDFGNLGNKNFEDQVDGIKGL